MDSRFIDTWNSKGLVLSRLERYEEALAAYDRALAIDPNNAQALNRKGLTLKKLEQFEESARAYDNAPAIDSANEKTQQNRERARQKIGALKRFSRWIAKS